MQLTGLLAVCDGGILYNGPQIASDRIIHEKSCNLFEKKSFTLCWFFICLFQRFFLLLLSLFNFSLVRLANPLNVFQCDWCPHLCCLILFCSSFCWEEACGWIVDAINVVCMDKFVWRMPAQSSNEQASSTKFDSKCLSMKIPQRNLPHGLQADVFFM